MGVGNIGFVRPGLTLHMIVKNEARCLERCLKSVRHAVDQIVVADTGSTDETIQILRDFDARIYEIPWPGAFDAARNFALDKVETEWVLFLDADEWFAEDPKAGLREAQARKDAFAYEFVRLDCEAGKPFAQQQLLRMWRNHPAMRMTGIVHEHFREDALLKAAEGRKLFFTGMSFWHDGYANNIAEPKLLRNLPLLEQELALRPDQPFIEGEIAKSKIALKDPKGWNYLHDRTMKYVAQDHLDSAPDPRIASLLFQFLTFLPESALNNPDTERVLRVCRGWFHDHPSLRFLCATIEIKRQNIRAALYDLLDIETLVETQKFDRQFGVQELVIGEGLWTNLGIVAHQLGRVDVAKRNYERLLKMNPNHPVAKQNLALL